MREITPQQLKQELDGDNAPLLLDVREPLEIGICAIEGSTSIPMGEIPTRLSRLECDRPIVVLCHHGMRSAEVGRFLEAQGYTGVSNLVGGIDAWASEIDLTMPRY